jgi:hypothetical protein
VIGSRLHDNTGPSVSVSCCLRRLNHGAGKSDIHSSRVARHKEQFRHRDNTPYKRRHPSLHHTRANNISSLNGSKLAADILRRQDEASSAARSLEALRLTWQFEVCYSKSSPFNRYRRDLLRDANRTPWQWNVAGSMCIPYTLSLHNELGYEHHARTYDLLLLGRGSLGEHLRIGRSVHDSSTAR